MPRDENGAGVETREELKAKNDKENAKQRTFQKASKALLRQGWAHNYIAGKWVWTPPNDKKGNPTGPDQEFDSRYSLPSQATAEPTK